MEPTPAAMSRRLATARRIKGLMGENDVTQTKLGAALGLTQGPISDRLTARRPFNTDELEAIADLFDVPITDLFGRDPVNPQVRRDGGGPNDDLRSRCFTDDDLLAADEKHASAVQFAPQLASV